MARQLLKLRFGTGQPVTLAQGVCLLLNVLLFLSLLAPFQSEAVKATLRMDQPHLHFYQVELVFPASSAAERRLQMATWTPGSYRIRDFAKSVEGFTALALDDRPLTWSKLDKATWKVNAPAGAPFKVRYSVFAYEFSVRTSYLDYDMGFANPASVFLYEAKELARPIEVQVLAPDDWGVASALPKLDATRFRAENFDQLVDSPFQFGNFRRHDFQVGQIPFSWTIAGDVDLNEAEMVKSLTKIGETVGNLFGHYPFERYHIFSQFRLTGAGGGLEHANSTMVQGSSFRMRTKKGWDQFLGLIIHEYFHAWNVKALHDQALGPFDYQNENYSELLWLHEGWTSYYDNLLMGRAGFWNDKELLKTFAKGVKDYLESPATTRQSLREASFDSWIHQYQPIQTSNNSQVSYYSEGAMSGLALDLLIRHETGNQKSLDDVMRLLYNSFAREKRGIDWQAVRTALEEVGGRAAAEFLDNHIGQAKPLPLEQLLGYAGLELKWKDEGEEDERKGPQAANPPVSLGVTTRRREGALVVEDVVRDRAGWQAGLDFGDELVAINDRRITADNLNEVLSWSRPDDEIKVLVNRSGRMLVLALKLEEKSRSLKLVAREKPSTLESQIYSGLFGEPKQEKDKNPSEPKAE